MAPGKDDRLSSEREAEKAAFLARHGLAAAVREPLAGDASTRLYERLHRPAGGSLIFMDQPPSLETAPCPPDATPAERAALGYNASARLAAGRVEAFMAAAGYLRAQGLSAPEVVAADAARGLAVLEDLGDGLYARLIEAGAAEAPLYEAAIDALLRLHQAAPPPPVIEAEGARWPLLAYDDLALKTGLDMFIEWWPKFAGSPAFSPDAVAEWDALWAPVRARGAAGASVFAHRDYHAENLVWRPERGGVARVGMLDFQDALRAHPAWDLLSLLQDARRDVSPELERAMLDRYLAARSELDREAFLADYTGLAALNATRIVFIFARQVAYFERPRYRALLPRVWGALERDLAAPGLAPIRAWFDRNVPLETRR
ncbi:MAG: phosphotransferase [Caulobacteraceae bacterium]|nr:phosphotransferase [Caulobacteraceae bacterium]